MLDYKKLGGPYYPVIEQFAVQDGYGQPWIAALSNGVLESMLPQYRKEIRRYLPAYCIGGFIPQIQLGQYAFGNLPFGIIVYDNNLNKVFDSDEMRFIFAHEYSHIVKNHTLLQYAGGVARDILDDWIDTNIKDQKWKTACSIGLDMVALGTKCIFTRQCEIDADLHASELAGSKNTGINAINKLCLTYAKGDFSKPTHCVAGIPVLTFQERINELKR